MRWLASVACAALAACATASGDSELQAAVHRFPLRATPTELATSLERHCARTEVRRYTPAEAAPYAEQSQIDCHGYVFRGAPRKVELLINEGALGFYWLMIAPEELDATQAELTADLGEPTCQIENYVIFNDASVALRREPAEILVALPADFQAITGGC